MKNEEIDILLPTEFPDDLTLKNVMVSVEGEYETIDLLFEEGLSYTVYKKAPIPKRVVDNFTPTLIGKTNVYMIDLTDVNSYQVYFAYKGDYYYIYYSDKQQVLEIIEKLEIYL